MKYSEWKNLTIREKLDYKSAYEPSWGDQCYGCMNIIFSCGTEIHIEYMDMGDNEEGSWIDELIQ